MRKRWFKKWLICIWKHKENRCLVLVNAQLGGLHSAKILLHSVDFHEVNRVEGLLERGAQSLEAGGADFLVLCTNTMHRLSREIEAAVKIPLLHIADATASNIKLNGVSHVGLLGTKVTMEKKVSIRGRLEECGLRVTVPAEADREIIHRVIFEELCHGRFLDVSRSEYIRVIEGLAKQGVEGVILGCTEIF